MTLTELMGNGCWGLCLLLSPVVRTQVINKHRQSVFCSTAPVHQIRSVRRSLPQHDLLTLIRTLDQCNSVLVGTSVYLQDRLQSVLNAAARLVYSRRTSEHTTPLLRELHWLRVPE